MIDKTRTIKRALRMIGVNYNGNLSNKKLLETEAEDVFDDIIKDILANKNYTFNVKRAILERAPDDLKLVDRDITLYRYYVPADLLNIVETSVMDLDMEGGYLVTTSNKETIWIKYCFNGEHTLVPDYFGRYVALRLAIEMSLIYKSSDKDTLRQLEEMARSELVAIDRTQFSNRPFRPDGNMASRLVDVRRRRKN